MTNYPFRIRCDAAGCNVAFAQTYEGAKVEAVRMAWWYRSPVTVLPDLERFALIASWDQSPPDAVPYSGAVDQATAARLCEGLGKGFASGRDGR